jgi:hypothetical protein
MMLRSNIHTSVPGAALTARGLAEHRERVIDMPKATCSIEGCTKPVHGHGWCNTHYARWLKHGDPFVVRTLVGASLADRLMFRTAETGSGCWSWIGSIDQHGYGKVRVAGKTLATHRVAYETFVGPVPDGLVLDHMCHNADKGCPGGPSCSHRRCLNPEHLEPATRSMNAVRGRGHGSETHCIRGHEFTPENTYVDSAGHRHCRTCRTCRRVL